MPNDDLNDDYVHERDVSPYAWLLRPCMSYWEEHQHCTSIKSRFYQYYIDGQAADCSQWKMSGRLCDRWERKQDKEALLALVELDKKRYVDRLTPHLENNVWERRKKPPENWNKTLPEEHQKRIEESHLKKLVESEIEPPSCVIS